MEDVKIVLSALWVSTMLIYLLGDVLRIFAGHMKPGEIAGIIATQKMWMAAAVLMLIPIVMVFLSITLPYPVNRWSNILAAILLFGVNIVGVTGYSGAYDRFLIIVSLGFNVLIVWNAWKWI